MHMKLQRNQIRLIKSKVIKDHRKNMKESTPWIKLILKEARKENWVKSGLRPAPKEKGQEIKMTELSRREYQRTSPLDQTPLIYSRRETTSFSIKTKPRLRTYDRRS